MGRQRSDDWSPRGAARALLWWPAIAFTIAAVLPDAGPLPIVVAGAALALVGALGAMVSRRLGRALVRGRNAAAEVASQVSAQIADAPVSKPVSNLPGAMSDVATPGRKAA